MKKMKKKGWLVVLSVFVVSLFVALVLYGMSSQGLNGVLRFVYEPWTTLLPTIDVDQAFVPSPSYGLAREQDGTPTLTPFQPEPYTSTPQPTSTPTNSPTPASTITPIVTITKDIPSHASIQGITGRFPTYSLDCEARSAVDWAAYFGVSIAELSFQASLPISDNPEKGFVGSVYGVWGQVPPNPYGVHAKPVAKLLRSYGLSAKAKREMTWFDLQKEIADGYPVIVWVVGRVTRGTPIVYQSDDGHKTIVARFEHTVIVIGYDEASVTVLDGGWVYSRSIKSFLDSWGVLGNMAIVYED